MFYLFSEMNNSGKIIAVVEALKIKQGFLIDEVLITHAEIPDSTNDTPNQD